MRYEPLLEKIRDNITVEACHELMVAIEADLQAEPSEYHDEQIAAIKEMFHAGMAGLVRDSQMQLSMHPSWAKIGAGLFPERWAEVRRAGEAYTKRQPQ